MDLVTEKDFSSVFQENLNVNFSKSSIFIFYRILYDFYRIKTVKVKGSCFKMRPSKLFLNLFFFFFMKLYLRIRLSIKLSTIFHRYSIMLFATCRCT